MWPVPAEARVPRRVELRVTSVTLGGAGGRTPHRDALHSGVRRMPPFIRNRLILLALGPSLIWFAFQIVQITALVRISPRATIAVSVAYIIVIIPYTILVVRWRRHIRRRLIACRGRLCFRC